MFDFDVYALAGDGCMMEGISGEAASLAGHLKLDNLCWIYDNNRITIEGHTHLAFSEDVATRFIGYGWNVTRVGDANDLDDARSRLRDLQGDERTGRRSIIVDSHIGYGAPTKQDTHAAHGEPLGEEEIKAAKRFYGWPEDEKFLVPDDVPSTSPHGIGARGKELRARVDERVSRPTRRSIRRRPTQLQRMQRRQLPDGWDADLPTFPADAKGMAGRDASAQSAERHRAEHPVAHRRLGRPGAVDQDSPDLRRRRRFPRRTSTAAATSTSASASTPWARC